MWNPNNLFLYDVMALEEPEQQAGVQNVPQLQQQPMMANAAADQHGNVHNVKLPEFWPHQCCQLLKRFAGQFCQKVRPLGKKFGHFI
jgi:hypothetical protein